MSLVVEGLDCKCYVVITLTLLQVLAYVLVTPDHFAERIYVRDTKAQLAALAGSGSAAAALPCADVLSAFTANASRAQAQSSGSADPVGNSTAWQPGEMAAQAAACLAGANETAAAAAQLAVHFLQAFVDTHGWAPTQELPAEHKRIAHTTRLPMAVAGW